MPNESLKPKIKCKTIKLLEDNICKNLDDLVCQSLIRYNKNTIMLEIMN